MGSRIVVLISILVILSSAGQPLASSGNFDSPGPLAPPAPIEGVVILNGNWNVTDYVSFLNATIYLSGNLTVKGTGYLEFVNTTLALNLSSNGQYRIIIEGKFTLNDLDLNPSTQSDASRIISNRTSYKYTMTAQPAARLFFNNSIVANCGYDGLNPGLSVLTANARFDGMRFQSNYYGITLRNSGAVVRNSTFLWCYYGVYVFFCNPTLENLIITGSSGRGMYLYFSRPSISGCILNNNMVGIYLQNSEPDIVSCSVFNSAISGICTWYSSPLLVDCELSNNLDMEVALSSFPRLVNTSLNQSRVSIGLGLYISMGQRLDVLVLNGTGEPQANLHVTVLDSEGNPASGSMTNESGIANNLAFRERFLTREGAIEMSQHRIVAFNQEGNNISYGENTTALVSGIQPVIEVAENPPGVEIWQAGIVISDARHINNTKIIALGDVNVAYGGYLGLTNSQIMIFSYGTQKISCASSSLSLIGSSINTIGTTRLLTPAFTSITADALSTVYMENASLRWITEFELRSDAAEIYNLTITHATTSGLKIISCTPTVAAITVDWAPVGLYLSGDGSLILNASINRAREFGVYAGQSAASFDHLRLNNSAIGIFSNYCLMDMTDVEINDCAYGIYAMYSVFSVTASQVNRSSGIGMYIIDSTIELLGGQIMNSATALDAQTSSVWVESYSIIGNNLGLKSKGCAPVLLNCSFLNTMDIQVERGSSASLVNCTLDEEKTSVAASGYIDLGDWVDIMVVDEALAPVAGCNVSIQDSMSQVSASGRTDPDGYARNMAFRQRRLLWNGTENYVAHTILAFRDYNGSLQGSNMTVLAPGTTAEVNVSTAAMGWIEWTGYKIISTDLNYSGKTIIAHSSVLINNDASLQLENSTLWFFGMPVTSVSMDVNAGAFNMRASRLMPLSANAPLQPSRLWLGYRSTSTGEIIDSSVKSINQITTYTSSLLIKNSTISDIAYTGLHIQACSPIIEDSLFLRCYEGIGSNSGSPSISNTSLLECANNGFYANGGEPILQNVHASFDIVGFYLDNGAKAGIDGCLASYNENGFYMVSSSPDISDSIAQNNSLAGFHCQDSHPAMEFIESRGNMQGLYCYQSWPVIYSSSLSNNSNGVYAYESAPFLFNCTLDGNQIGYNSLGGATDITTSSFTSGQMEENAVFVNGGMRDFISVTLPTRAIVTEANLSIRGTEIGRDAVIADKYTQYSPAIYDNWVVWQEFRNEDWDIYAYNLSVDSDGNGVPNYLETPQLVNDPALVRITNNPYLQGEPDIYGDTIVWTDFRNGNPDIYAFTFSNSTEWAVCKDGHAQFKPAIDGDRIVWQDYRNGNYDVYMLNITKGNVARLTDFIDDDMSPKIQGNFVTWYSYHGSPPSNDYSDIYLFDLRTWRLVNLNNDTALQYNPDVYGNYVVWHDSRNGNWEIYLYNIDTQVITRLTYDVDKEQNFMPRIYGDRVIYYFHHRVTDVWSVRMFNITTGIQTILEYETNGDSIPVIHGQRVAWLNKSGNLNDIYVLDFNLSSFTANVSLDINMDGTSEFQTSGEFSSRAYINESWLVSVFNQNLGRISGGTTAVPISIAANGTGRVILGPMTIKYDIPTYIVGTIISNSSITGAWCANSGPTFVNSSFQYNEMDISMGSEARPRTLNSTFSDSKIQFQDRLSNLTVQNFLHVRVENLTQDPMDARVQIRDNGHLCFDAFTGVNGEVKWIVVTDATYNWTGRNDNMTQVTAILNFNIFVNNPRSVDMAASHWEVFSTDSIGPIAINPFPPPGWTFNGLRPEISVIITDNLGIVYSSIRLYVKPYMVFYEAAPVPGGYNISYQHPVDFANGSVVQCRIYCRDTYGNILDYSWEFKIDVRAEYFAIELQPGWNLISLPFDTHNMSVESVLNSIAGKYDAVRAYSPDNPGGPWLGYRPDRPAELNDLATFDKKMGYWVHVSEACTLQISGVPTQTTSITLHAGWNLVGYPTRDGARTLSYALWGTGADRVEGLDMSSPSLLRVLPPNYVMKPGEAFWVRVPSDTIWTINW
jgi:beta propeller repeat protein